MKEAGGRINLGALSGAAIAVAAGLLLGGGASSAFGQNCVNSIDDAWVGGSSGDWSGASNWSAGEPSSTCDVFITSGAAVLMDVSGNTANLTVGSGNSLTLPSVVNTNNSLTVAGSVLSNGGQIILPAPFMNFGGTSLDFDSGGTVTLSGGGTITLSANSFGSDGIGGSGAGALLLNEETIEGSGSFDMSFNNASTGVINANQSGEQLVIGRNNSNGNSSNAGLIEATGGGQIAMGSLTLSNVGGTIQAVGSNSSVYIEGEGQGGQMLTGGTYTTSGGGVINILNSTTMDGTNGNTINNKGTMVLPAIGNNAGASFQGTLNNTATLEILASASGGVGLGIPSGQTFTLTGKGGNLTMGDGTNNAYNNNNSISGGTFVNQQLVQGTGTITNLTSFTNSSGATINDNVPVGSANLQLQLGRAGASTNAGTIEASNGGGIVIGSTTITNTSGTMMATGSGSYIDLSGSLGTSGLTVSGGTYTTSSGGTIYLGGGTLLDGTGSNPITNSGLILIDDYRSNGQMQGSVTNSGTIQMTSTGDQVSLCIPTNQTLTLNGAGITMLGDGTNNINNNQILLGCAGGNGGALVNASTIEGAGSIGNIASVTNTGTINANQPVGVNNLILALSGGANYPAPVVTNSNILEATNGGALQIDTAVTNTNGKIQAVGSGSYVQLYSSAAVLTGGTLTTSSGGTIYLDQSPTLSTVTNSGTMVIQDNNNATFSGTLTNTGTITVSSTGDQTNLLIPSGSTTTFTGSGTITMTANANNYLAGTGCGGMTLTNQSTIQGSGTIFPNTNCFGTLNNSGTINANQSGVALTIQAANLTNTGTLEATNGAGLILLGANVTNTSHTISATGTGSFLQFSYQGYSSAVTGGTIAATNGATAYAYNYSTFTGITNTGSMVIPDNNFSTFSGTITNNGTINLTSTGDATTFIIPAGGTATLAGTGTLTLTSTSNENAIIASSNCSSATLINESTIQGSGQVFPNTNCYGVLTNQGTITANQTNPLFFYGVNFSNTGTLTVASGSTMSFHDSTSSFSNLVSGTNGYTLSGGTYQVTGTLQIPGDIYENSANITLTGASALIEDESGTNSLSMLTVNSSTGTLTLASGQNLATTANFTNSGVLNLSPGTLSVTGSFTQSGTIGESIGGATAGTQYGQVKASGTVTAGGTLNITLTNGYIPAIGAAFTILSGSTVSGQFSKVNGTTINGTEHFLVEYSSNAVSLEVERTSSLPWSENPNQTVDFYGDGKGEPAVWRPSTGTWYVMSNGGGGDLQQGWGLPGDIPVAADYEGEGKDQYAVFRPTTATWYVYTSSGEITQQWGDPGDVPVPADYDGDGKTDFAVWRPSTGTFWVILSSTGKTESQVWGEPGDVPVRGDFDGDGKNDYAVFRPSNYTWYVILSSTGKTVNTPWGLTGDIPVEGDYDGDGKTDYAIWRPDTGTWWIILSSTGKTVSYTWGVSGDIPAVGDFDGDGKNDYAVFRPSNATWYFVYSGGGEATIQWGETGDVPATHLASMYERDKHIANFDGDRKADLGVFRPSTGTWWAIDSSTGKDTSQVWGENGDIPVPGDYDGDGKTDYAIWRPSTQTWWTIYSSTGKEVSQLWGASGDILVPGDYDGDGKTDYAIWRPSTQTWWVILSSTGKEVSQLWGASGDIPVPADYDGDGKTDYAIWRPSTGTWWVILSSTGKEVSQVYGMTGDIPVPGDYDGDTKADYTVFRPSTGTWYTLESSTGKSVSTVFGQSGDIPVAKDYDGDEKTDIAIWRPSTATWYILQSSTGTMTITQWGESTDVPVNQPTGY